MDKVYEESYHRFEEENWWFKGRRLSIVQQLLIQNIDKNARILDIGCSSGCLAVDLKNAGFKNIQLLDYSPEAIAQCKSKGFENAVLGDGHYPPFPPHSFDVIIASDCLEHLKEDQVAIENWKNILKPNGLMLIYVPAYPSLWSKHDLINHHYRRYTKQSFLQLFKNNDLSVQEFNYWNIALFPPVALVRKFEKRYQHLDEIPEAQKTASIKLLPGWLNRLLAQFLLFESKLGRKIRYPFGISVYAIVRK